MRISEFFKSIRKKPPAPGTKSELDDLLEPVTGVKLKKGPEPAGTLPVPGTVPGLDDLLEPATRGKLKKAPGPAGTIPEPEVTEPKKADASFRHYFHIFRKRATTDID
ncbi:MAG: hypothetical protein NTV84_05885, partial [Methanoregula sp.]|nr:hypothetical protein [Methanoregula sp.]